MNIYSFDVSFSTGVISSPYFTLVVNDHNSTTFKFTFDQDGRHVFKLLYPDGTYYVQDIVNDELVLGKGVLNQSGNYKFEISLYGEDNRLTTSLTQEFAVRLELVDTDELVSVDDRVPVLDNLIEETNTILQEAKDGKFDGATFTPNVSESGDLSWSNDKGKENPPTVNIMGPPGEPGAVKMQVVDVLPETGETDTIYLVKKSTPNEQNLYDEYVYANGTWEHIGDTSVDLSDYYTKSETDNKLDEKQNTLTAGENITIDENNVISSGKTNYLGYIEDYTPDNRLDITDLEKGTYSLGIKDRIGSQTLYLKVSHNGQEQTLDTTLQIEATVVSNMIYFDVRNPIKDISGYDEVVRISFSYLNSTTGEIVNTKYGISYNNTSGILSNSARYNTKISAMTTDTKQVIRGEKTFNVLPESSVEPTNDNQFVNKKYVDDNKYELPIASTDTLGGIKIGENLSIDENGVVSASGGSDLPIYVVTTGIIIAHDSTTDVNALSEPRREVDLTDIYTELSNIINNLYINGEEGFQLILKAQKWLIPFYCCNILRGKLGIQSKPNGIYFATPYTTCYSINGINNDLSASLGYFSLNLTLTWTDNICTVTKASYSWRQINVSASNDILTKTNTSSYKPTNDYHPSTKKYVDDSINNLNTKLNETLSSIPTHQELIDNGFDYLIETEIITNNYTVENISTSYGFELNENEYYESNNKHVDNSYSLCKVTFNNERPLSIPISYISYGENNYDYGIFGNIDQILSNSNSDDGATGTDKVFKNCKGESSPDAKEIIYDIPAGEHFIYIKYRKDNGGYGGNDTLQFKIPTEITNDIFENRKMATTKYVDNSIKSAITDALGGSY